MESNRIYSLDTIKCLAAFFVVSLHTPSLPLPLFPEILTDIARVAVPLFLMVSGYFTYSNNSSDISIRIKKNIRKALNLLFVSIIIYLIVDIIAFQDLSYILSQARYLLSFDFWFFGTVPFSPVSWYLVAYIYSLLIYLLIQRLKIKDKFILSAIPIFLIIWLFTGSYQSFLFRNEIPLQYNTCWIMALPFFLIGAFFKKYESRIKNLNVSNFKLFLLIIMFCISTILEHIIIKKITNHSVNGTGYISTLFLVITIYIALMKNSKFGKDSIFNRIGRDYSMYIFIFHVAINYILCRLFLVKFEFVNIHSFEPLIYLPYNYQYVVNNITVFLITLAFSVFLTKTKLNKKIGI